MKKTFTINISGFIFNIDDDAFDKLQEYLNALKKYFTKNDEGHEIVSDIEARIAELFKERVGNNKEVITLNDVDDIISIMGSAEDLIGDDSSESKEDSDSEPEPQSYKSSKGRRIYRDTDRRVLGGVCAGLGAYFNIDPVIIRVLMVFTFFFAGPLLYIILWIIIPEANTTAQKLEMRGEPITVENIEKKIKEEFENVKQSFHKMKHERRYKDSSNIIEKFVHLVIILIELCFKFAFTIIGGVFVVVAITLLVVFGITLLSGTTFSHIPAPIVNFLEIIMDPQNISIGILGLALVIMIPVTGLLYSGIKLLLGIRYRNKAINILGIAIFISGVVLISLASVRTAVHFDKENSDYEVFKLEEFVSSTLILKANMVEYDFDIVDHEDWHEAREEIAEEIEKNDHHKCDKSFPMYKCDPKFIEEKDESLSTLLCPNINIEKSYNNDLELLIERKSRGLDKKDALSNATYTQYHWDVKDTTIIFDDYFKIPSQKKFRAQQMDITLKIPVNHKIYIDNNMGNLINDAFNRERWVGEEMVGKTWIMKEDGLHLVE